MNAEEPIYSGYAMMFRNRNCSPWWPESCDKGRLIYSDEEPLVPAPGLPKCIMSYRYACASELHPDVISLEDAAFEAL